MNSDDEYEDIRRKKKVQVVVEEIKKPEKKPPKIAQIIDFRHKNKENEED